jgi:hypothetical protein
MRQKKLNDLEQLLNDLKPIINSMVAHDDIKTKLTNVISAISTSLGKVENIKKFDELNQKTNEELFGIIQNPKDYIEGLTGSKELRAAINDLKTDNPDYQKLLEKTKESSKRVDKKVLTLERILIQALYEKILELLFEKIILNPETSNTLVDNKQLSKIYEQVKKCEDPKTRVDSIKSIVNKFLEPQSDPEEALKLLNDIFEDLPKLGLNTKETKDIKDVIGKVLEKDESFKGITIQRYRPLRDGIVRTQITIQDDKVTERHTERVVEEGITAEKLLARIKRSNMNWLKRMFKGIERPSQEQQR